MQKIKMIATDLDRTLLRSKIPGDKDSAISDYTKSIFDKCADKGIKIVFATARRKRMTTQYLEKIPADAVILHNGAVIYIGEEQIFHSGITPDTTKNILYSINHDFPDATISVGINDKLYANFKIPDTWSNTEATLADFSDFNKLFEYLPDKPAEKIIIGLRSVDMLTGNWEHAVKHFEKYLTDDLYVEINSERFIFIMSRKAKKSLAVKFLAERYGFDIKETAAFGDDYNDIEMLAQCGASVAVANAIDEAKAAAGYICASNDEDGVAKWIEKNILKE